MLEEAKQYLADHGSTFVSPDLTDLVAKVMAAFAEQQLAEKEKEVVRLRTALGEVMGKIGSDWLTGDIYKICREALKEQK